MILAMQRDLGWLMMKSLQDTDHLSDIEVVKAELKAFILVAEQRRRKGRSGWDNVEVGHTSTNAEL